MISNNELLTKNFNVARRVAKKYALSQPSKYADFLQEAYLGMMKALEKFDANKGEYRARAHVYAERAIQNYIKDKETMFNWQGAEYNRLFWKTSKIKLAYEQGEEAIAALCEKENVTKEVLDDIMIFLEAKPCSYHSYGKGTTLEHDEGKKEDTMLLFSAAYDNIEDEIDKKKLQAIIKKALKRLPDYHREVLEAMYFGPEPKTMSAVAEERGVSRQAVDQVQKKALERLKTILLNNRTFLELVNNGSLELNISELCA